MNARETAAHTVSQSTQVAVTRAALAELLERHERAFLAFSGGKDSLALLRLCEPWRDRLTLLWANTGHMAPHAAAFVREHAARFALVEVSPVQPMMEQWAEHGAPAEILPLEHLEGVDWRSPRLQPWTACCGVNRNAPLLAYVEAQDAPCALLMGQRRTDRGGTVAGLSGVTLPRVEIAMPLWDWTTADVLAFIAEQGIRLAPYHDEVPASLECIICPAGLSPEKLRLLDRLYPEAAASARHTARLSLAHAARKVSEIVAALDAVAPANPETRA